MSLRPYFLRFASESEARTVGASWLQLNADGSYVVDVATPIWCYHVCGILWRPAVLDAQGKVITPATQKAGFHVNVLADPARWPAGLNPYLVDPVTPDSIFGGMPSERPAWGWGEKPEGWGE